jgi:RNA polymerase sigma-70 factor (ECF subfamily)
MARAVALPGTARCDRDDALQHALLELLRRREQLAALTDAELLAYGQAVARAALVRAHRGHCRRKRREGAWATWRDLLVPGPGPRLEAVEALGSWLRAVRSLPAEQQRVVLACDVQFTPVAKVAAELGEPTGTVRSRLRAARLHLRAHEASARSADDAR